MKAHINPSICKVLDNFLKESLESAEDINHYHSLGNFSRQQIDDIFLISPRKYVLLFMQIAYGDNLHEMSKQFFNENEVCLFFFLQKMLKNGYTFKGNNSNVKNIIFLLTGG